MNGKFQSVAFKIVAVVSALAIGGGYVFWRQSEARKAEHLESVERAKVKDNKEKFETLLLSGSKSYTGGTLIKEGDLVDGGLLLPPQEEEEEVAIPQDLLPSSKIGIIRLRSKDSEPPKEKELKLLPGSKSAPFELIPEEPEKSE